MAYNLDKYTPALLHYGGANMTTLTTIIIDCSHVKSHLWSKLSTVFYHFTLFSIDLNTFLASRACLFEFIAFENQFRAI